MTASTPQHIPSLDGIRAIAVLMVAAFHFGYLPFGWIGVQVFFVLSGYLITNILVRERHYPLSLFLKRFYWRRALRILPLYYAFLGISLAFFYVVRKKSLMVFVALFTYSYNWVRGVTHSYDDSIVGHLWSLSVEEQFYLLWPFVLYFASPRILKLIVMSLLIASPLLRLASSLMSPEQGVFQYYATVTQIDSFATGAAIAIFSLSRVRRLRALLWIAGAAVLTPIAIDSARLAYPIFMPAAHQFAWGYLLINAASAAAVIACIRGMPVLRLLQYPALVYLGRISYGFYLFHLPILTALRGYTRYQVRSLTSLPIFVLFIGITIAVSTASYYLFERRFLRLKNARFDIPSLPASTRLANNNAGC